MSHTSAATVLTLVFSLAASAQDRRTVVEPAFPPVCTTLEAALQISGGEPSSETAFDTARIQAALNACGAGSAVELAMSGANAAFLIGPITLPANVGLIVDGGVTVFASRNPADYQISGSGFETCGTVGTAGNGCKNLITPSAGSSIMGYGIIDGRGGDAMLNGSGKSWWDIASAANTGSNDQNNFVMIEPSGSANGFTLYKITLRNSAMFHVVWKGQGFTAWDVKIATPYTARNTDGIDPGGSDITIAKSWISDGDDDVAVSASSATGYISISDVHAYSGHGISIGSFTRGGLTNMLVDHVNLAGTAGDGSGNGIRIKSAQDRGGLVQNVTYQNMCVGNEAHPLELNPFYDNTAGTQLPQFSNIALRNVHFLSEGKVQLQGYDASHLSSITFDNVVFDNLQSSDLSPAPANVSIALGPGAVYPAFLQTLSGTNVTVTGSAPASNASAYDCTNAFPPLVGELYLAPNPTAQSLKLQATLQPTLSQVSYGNYAGAPALTKAINFIEGASVVGSAALSANGTYASLTLTNVGGGAHTYTAQYPGDANYPPFAFGSVTVTLAGTASAPSTTELQAPASSSYGDALTLTADVAGAGATPTGSVQFTADGTALGSAALVNGTATLALPRYSLGAGTHSLIASYGGDAVYASSASAPQSSTVSKGAAAVTLALPPDPVLVNSPVTLVANVPGASDGTVTFYNGAAPIGAANVASGSAAIHVTPAAVGTLSITAAYSGGANYDAATSPAASLTVVAPFTLAATPSAVTLPGQISIAVTPQAGFTGSVTLSCSGSGVTCTLSQATATLPATVTASLSANPSASLWLLPTAMPAFLFFFGRKRRKNWLAIFALLAAACGGSGSPAKSTAVTITARSGAASVSTQVTATAGS
jgi:hypothetical protein